MSDDTDFTEGIIRPRPDLPGLVPGPGGARPAGGSKPPPLPGIDNRIRMQSGSATAAPSGNATDGSLTAGWLVIMAGPGRGRSLALGVGINHLGRSPGNRLVLDFGDGEISRQAHTTVTYDPRGKKFYVQPGPEAIGLTYLGDENNAKPVLTPTEITGGETISLGRTRLKFIPFCGPAFSWE